MTGYQSKKKAASAKTIDEVNWADHEPDGRRAEQEPVAWLTRDSVDGCWYATANKVGKDDKPLYTTPPKREWVGLTKEEAKEISLANRPYVIDMIAALEARLKEKNSD